MGRTLLNLENIGTACDTQLMIEKKKNGKKNLV
jgi:hypothetical protein